MIYFSNIKLLRGESWLYSTNAIFRILPKELRKHIQPVEMEAFHLKGLMLWLQFQGLEEGSLMKSLQIFADRISKIKSVDDLMDSFPYAASNLECKMKDLYRYLEI